MFFSFECLRIQCPFMRSNYVNKYPVWYCTRYP